MVCHVGVCCLYHFVYVLPGLYSRDEVRSRPPRSITELCEQLLAVGRAGDEAGTQAVLRQLEELDISEQQLSESGAC